MNFFDPVCPAPGRAFTVDIKGLFIISPVDTIQGGTLLSAVTITLYRPLSVYNTKHLPNCTRSTTCYPAENDYWMFYPARLTAVFHISRPINSNALCNEQCNICKSSPTKSTPTRTCMSQLFNFSSILYCLPSNQR